MAKRYGNRELAVGCYVRARADVLEASQGLLEQSEAFGFVACTQQQLSQDPSRPRPGMRNGRHLAGRRKGNSRFARVWATADLA